MPSYRSLHDLRTPLEFNSRADWEQVRDWLRRQLAVSLGQLPAPPSPTIQGECFGRWEGPGYTCEKVAIESLPGFFLTGNLYRPTQSREPQPVVLCPHGHWEDGRLHDRDPLGSVPARCIHLARQGCLVLSYDMVGYNDSCQLTHRQTTSDPAWGFSMMALQTWNSRRALDFMLNLPGSDPERVGITGASGGGTQSFVMMALDDRLTAAAPIVMVSLKMQGGCICENAPLLRLHASNLEIAATFAPKPLFLGSCTRDWTRHTPERERPAMERIYQLYQAGDQVQGLHVDDGHNYNLDMRQAVYGFFDQCFFGGTGEPQEEETKAPRPPHPDRLVWWGRPAPEPLTLAEIHALWRERQQAALKPILDDPTQIQAKLLPLLPHALACTPDGSSPSDFTIDLHAQQQGDKLHVAGPPPEVNYPPEITHADTYNTPPLLQQAHAIRQALQSTGATALGGDAKASPACLLAATLSPGLKTLDLDLSQFRPQDDASWDTTFPTPFLRQIGGLTTLRAALDQHGIRVSGLPVS